MVGAPDVEDECPLSDEKDVPADVDCTEVQGLWILHISMDRRFHRRRWGSLGPGMPLRNWYAFYTQDPRVDDFQLCGRSSCFAGV